MTPSSPMLRTLHAAFPRLLAFLSISLVCAGIGSQTADAASSEVVDRIVAVVNDDIVVLQEIDKLLSPIRIQMQTAGYSTEQMATMLFDSRQQVINQLVEQKLINQASREFQLTITAEEIDAYIERIKESNRFTDEQFRETLKKQGIDMESMRSQIKENMLASKLENYEVRSKIVITKEDVTAYYNENPEKYKGETTYHLRNILLNAPEGESASGRAAVDKKFEQILAEFKAGKSFEALARQYSESPFAEDGGELGNFKLDDLSPNLQAAVAPLSAGQITPVLETSEGYQVLFLQEIITKTASPVDSVYTEIEDVLYQEQYKKKRQEWIDGLKKGAHIKIIN